MNAKGTINIVQVWLFDSFSIFRASTRLWVPFPIHIQWLRAQRMEGQTFLWNTVIWNAEVKQLPLIDQLLQSNHGPNPERKIPQTNQFKGLEILVLSLYFWQLVPKELCNYNCSLWFSEMIGDKYNMDNWNWELGNYKPELYLMISFNVHFHWTLRQYIVTEPNGLIPCQDLKTMQTFYALRQCLCSILKYFILLL